MIKLRGIDHLVLRVRDPDRMIDFYTRVLGCSVDWRRPDFGGLCHLRVGPSTMIDMVPVDSDLGKRGGAAPGSEGRNVDHFCLQVENFDVAAITAHLEAHGAQLGQTMSRYGAEGRGDSIYVIDPEGNTVELKGDSDQAPRYPGEPNPKRLTADVVK